MISWKWEVGSFSEYTKNNCKLLTVNLQLKNTPPAPLERGVQVVIISSSHKVECY